MKLVIGIPYTSQFTPLYLLKKTVDTYKQFFFITGIDHKIVILDNSSSFSLFDFDVYVDVLYKYEPTFTLGEYREVLLKYIKTNYKDVSHIMLADSDDYINLENIDNKPELKDQLKNNLSNKDTIIQLYDPEDEEYEEYINYTVPFNNYNTLWQKSYVTNLIPCIYPYDIIKDLHFEAIAYGEDMLFAFEIIKKCNNKVNLYLSPILTHTYSPTSFSRHRVFKRSDKYIEYSKLSKFINTYCKVLTKLKDDYEDPLLNYYVEFFTGFLIYDNIRNYIYSYDTSYHDITNLLEEHYIENDFLPYDKLLKLFTEEIKKPLDHLSPFNSSIYYASFNNRCNLSILIKLFKLGFDYGLLFEYLDNKYTDVNRVFHLQDDQIILKAARDTFNITSEITKFLKVSNI